MVAYNRRGIDEIEKNSNEGSNQQALMDKEQCFKVVVAAVKSVAENSVVDLRSPEVTLTDNCNSLHSYLQGRRQEAVHLSTNCNDVYVAQ